MMRIGYFKISNVFFALRATWLCMRGMDLSGIIQSRSFVWLVFIRSATPDAASHPLLQALLALRMLRMTRFAHHDLAEFVRDAVSHFVDDARGPLNSSLVTVPQCTLQVTLHRAGVQPRVRAHSRGFNFVQCNATWKSYVRR